MEELETTADLDAIDIRALQHGEEGAAARAFSSLIRRHNRLMNLCLLRFTRDAATLQDLRQETMLEVYRSLSTYQHQGTFGGWLRQVATRVGYQHWARMAKEARSKEAYVELSQSEPENVPTHPEENLRLKELLDMLDHTDRAVVEMRFVAGLKIADIAREMGWNPTRARVRLHRALKCLRKAAERNRAFQVL